MIEQRAGRLKKMNHCNFCKKRDNSIHSHHEDYNFPLKLLYLCAKCHAELHTIKRSYHEKGIKISFEIAN